MNPIDEHPPISDDQPFDQLVDGELSEQQRRNLLSQLDDQPGGWRRCALAFLQAQSWKQEFAAIARETPHQLPARPLSRKSPLGGRSGTLLAMVASFLGGALLLGSILQRESGVPGSIPSDVALFPRPQAGEQLPGLPQLKTASGQVCSVNVPGLEGKSQRIRVPAVEGQRIDKKWLSSLPVAIPQETLEVLRALEREGFRVRWHRGFLPLRTRDGRQLVAPVDGVDVYFIGNPPL